VPQRHPVPRHGLPVAGPTPVALLVAACDGGGNPVARAWRMSHQRQRARRPGRAARRRTTITRTCAFGTGADDIRL